MNDLTALPTSLDRLTASAYGTDEKAFQSALNAAVRAAKKHPESSASAHRVPIAPGRTLSPLGAALVEGHVSFLPALVDRLTLSPAACLAAFEEAAWIWQMRQAGQGRGAVSLHKGQREALVWLMNHGLDLRAHLPELATPMYALTADPYDPGVSAWLTHAPLKTSRRLNAEELVEFIETQAIEINKLWQDLLTTYRQQPGAPVIHDRDEEASLTGHFLINGRRAPEAVAWLANSAHALPTYERGMDYLAHTLQYPVLIKALLAKGATPGPAVAEGLVAWLGNEIALYLKTVDDDKERARQRAKTEGHKMAVLADQKAPRLVGRFSLIDQAVQVFSEAGYAPDQWPPATSAQWQDDQAKRAKLVSLSKGEIQKGLPLKEKAGSGWLKKIGEQLTKKR